MLIRPTTRNIGSKVHGLCIQTAPRLRSFHGYTSALLDRSRDSRIHHNIHPNSNRSLRIFATPSSTMSAPKTMKAVDIKGGKGGIDALFINSESAVPTPKPTDALVKIKAFGLNRMDRTSNCPAKHHFLDCDPLATHELTTHSPPTRRKLPRPTPSPINPRRRVLRHHRLLRRQKTLPRLHRRR